MEQSIKITLIKHSRYLEKHAVKYTNCEVLINSDINTHSGRQRF